MKICNLVTVLFGVLLSLNKSYGQTTSDFAYLVSCFENSSIDSFEVEISGIGSVMTYNLISDSVNIQAGLSYYDIPVIKRSESTEKLARFAANMQIETWKNNSRLILYNESKSASAIVIDARIHMIFEDIYMQVIVVLENDRVYEILHFQDNNDTVSFDRLTEKIKNQTCP